MICVEDSPPVSAVHSGLGWGRIYKADCIFFFFFFPQSQGCWDNLEIRSLPETKIVFTSGQKYLTLLSSCQMIFHCNIPWLQNAWTCSHSWASCQIMAHCTWTERRVTIDQNRSCLSCVCLDLLWCFDGNAGLCSQFDTSFMLLLIKSGFCRVWSRPL